MKILIWILNGPCRNYNALESSKVSNKYSYYCIKESFVVSKHFMKFC